MEFSQIARSAVVALALVVLLDWGVWCVARFYLSSDYEGGEFWKASRTFPDRWRFQIAKAIVGLAFVLSFVWVMHVGPSEHEDFAVISLAILVPFGIASFWDSVKAFRHFAASNLKPRGRGGYREP
jgi:hypothetical protein